MRRKVDYWGGCPECGKHDGCLNVERTHWFVCHEHRACWCVGANLFDAWRHQTDEEFLENAKLLSGYAEVEPLPWTLPKEGRIGAWIKRVFCGRDELIEDIF